MPAARRPQLDDRRRLVIYSQRFAEDGPAQSKRGQAADAALRCARKPAAAYGWRVQRRLRARWFSMVPVRRRTLCGVLGAIAAIVVVLAFGHWAALWWAPLALRPELARSLRLDRPDSLGTWFSSALMAATGVTSLLVYQLRRYRTDDYRGHYRLWPVAIVVSLLASIDAVSNLVGWVGAAVDVALAERDVLAGADWVRLLLTVGGAAFGLRLIAELSRCRTAAVSAVLALGLLGVSPAVRWNLLRLEPSSSLTWVPVALLAGRAVLLGTAIIYLRMLYREVRDLNPGIRLRDRLRERLQSLLHQRRAQAVRPEATSAPPSRSRNGSAAKHEVVSTRDRRTENSSAEGEDAPEARSDVAVASDDGDRRQNGTSKRRFAFWLRSSKSGAADAAAKADVEADDSGDEKENESREGIGRERRRFAISFRRRRGGDPDGALASDGPSGDSEGERAHEDAKRERRKLGFPFSRRRTRDTEENESVAGAKSSASEGDEANDDVKQERRRFAFGFGRRHSRGAEESESAASELSGDRDEAQEDVKRERKRFAFAFGRRRAVTADNEEESADAPQDPPRPSTASQRAPSAPPPAAAAAELDEEDLDPETIDWDSLNKSERRRVRKLMKRQGKAA